jgi:cob(I)alamin adenosyltransferase
MKIYTKTGDQGTTSLLGGTRVPKFHPRIEAYGTIDELNAFVGLIADQDIDQHYKKVLMQVQERLFTLESQIARDPEIELNYALPEIKSLDIRVLEDEMDKMNEGLPELKNFVLPGGHPTVSYCHIARCICRRAERNTLRLSQAQAVDPQNIMYLNRLSDYFFVLARKMAQELDVNERLWKTRS